MCFQEEHGINKIDENYRDHVNVTHEFSLLRMTSKLLLYTDVADINTYRCEVRTRTEKLCFDSKPIMFHGKVTNGAGHIISHKLHGLFIVGKSFI